MKEIDIAKIEGFRIGNSENIEGGTGCTVIIAESGAKAGISVRGGGPATRETDLLNPEKMTQEIHGLVLSGGSAYGLDSATGVMRYLEDRGIGFDVGMGVVPIVPAACLFDLIAGDFKCRPDAYMGYAACVDSEKKREKIPCGNVGAGTGATVGKFLGVERLVKSGLGTYAVQIGALKIGAIVAVNALGDIFDADSGEKLAGILNEQGDSLDDTSKIMHENILVDHNVFTGNTTIGCIITNACLNKAQCNKMADMAHDGYARAIKPVHTSADGDTIFFMANGDAKTGVNVNQDALGDLGAYVMAKAINVAVREAKSAYGFKAMADL